MDIWSVVIGVVILLVTLIIFYARRASRYFQLFDKMGIPNPKPWPALGNLPEIISEGFLNYFDRIYKKYENEKVVKAEMGDSCLKFGKLVSDLTKDDIRHIYRLNSTTRFEQEVIGIHEPGKAFFMIKDLDMLRDVCIKNFNCFVNRRNFLEREPFDTIMPSLKDEQWKRIRNAMSPAFSTGKLKHMFFHVEQSASVLVSNLKQSCKEDKLVELKDIVSCFSMDVIASTGFGVNLDSLNDKENQFIKHARKIITGLSGFVFAMESVFPSLINVLEKLGIELYPLSSARFFHKFVHEAVANRKETKTSVKRTDFIQVILEKEEFPSTESGKESTNYDENEKKGMTLYEFQGQALIFFIAGFDTVSTTMSFTLFILAHHPECVTKLQGELDRVLCGKPPTYESVQELTYLEMCINEAMRMYPAGFFVDRQCNEECNIGGIQIPKDTFVLIPIMSIQNDPKLWPEPEKFDPERFTTENKEGRHPFAYLPFGQGPRNCIGMRLALLEIKVGMASILQEMTPVPCEKSVYPMKLDKYDMIALDGLWVKFISRNK